MNSSIRIMVVDDHPVVRKGMAAILETEPGFEVIALCSNGEEAIQKAVELLPDVILMDLVMPKMDGIEATRAIKERLPDARILVVTSFSTTDKVFPSLQAGAAGYLLKDSDPSELILAIRRVASGEGWLNPEITRRVLDHLSSPPPSKPDIEELTERETAVLKEIARGLSNTEIALALSVSEATVHTHVSRILSKLNLASRTQAALYALRKGLVSLDSI